MTIVVYATGSPEGAAALEWAIHEAAHAGTGEHLELVLGHSDRPSQGVPVADETIARFREVLTASGLEHTVHAHTTDPADEALRLVRVSRARHLVIGVRGRSATSKILLGSQVQYILSTATCPVTCIKAGWKAD